MTKIAFICDAGCDIDPQYTADNDIYTIPFAVNFTDKSYLDGVDITRDQVYEMMKTEIPTTCVCSADIIIKSLKEIKSQGIKNIIIASISSKISGMHNLMRMCADEFEDLNIELIDTEQVSIGAGFPIIKGVEAYKNGASFEEVVKTIKDAIKDVHVYVYFRDLTNLIKGGRVPKGKAYIANALNIKPVMTIENGEMAEVKKIRGSKKAIRLFREKYNKHITESSYISAVYASNQDDLSTIEDEFQNEIQNAKYTQRTQITPTIAVHAGTEFLAVVFMKA